MRSIILPLNFLFDMSICFNCFAIYKDNKKIILISDTTSNKTSSKSSLKSQNTVRSWLISYFCLQDYKRFK